MSKLYDSIEELFLELEDEESDSLGGQTVAIVAGAFRPPHLGHVSMVKHYSNIADQVVIIIPTSLRSNRTINDKVITANDSQKIWNLLLADEGLENVKIEKSNNPSHISATFDFIGNEGPLKPGTKVILGASSKGNDLKRWKSAKKFIKQDVTLLTPEETAIEPATMPSGELYNSSEARKNLEAGEDADIFFGKGRTQKVRSILGLDQIDEISAMGAGAVQGSVGSISRRKPKNKEQKEYNELYLYKEVIKLLKNKGIVG